MIKHSLRLLIAGTAFFFVFSFTLKRPHRPAYNQTVAPRPLFPVPSEKQLRWHEMEMNAFIHFTSNTFTGLEWGMGSESPAVFNPTKPDARQWVKILKQAGFKGIILTAKHHDGFCLWPSKFTEHSVKSSSYKGGKADVVKELSDACRDQQVKFGIYLSPWDRNRADYGRASYIDYYRNQLKELFTNYGPVFEMWFDGANGGLGYYGGANETRKINAATYYEWPATLAMVSKIQPEVLFFSDAGPDLRWVGNERGSAGLTNWNTIDNDTLYAGKAGIEQLLNQGAENGSKWIPAEVDVSIRPGWFYHQKEDSLVKSPERLFEIYLSSVGRGSTLLLNVPPDQRGLIHENDIKALRGFRLMLDSTFKTDLAKGAVATASAYRGGAPAYAASKAIDGDKNSYWATDDGVTTASLDISLAKKKRLSYVILQEYIRLGQRIKSFTVEAWQENRWSEVASATTVGYKRIVKLTPVETDKIRVNIREAKACPVISSVQLY